MKNRRNYYRVLHVQPDAPREIIRSSYRTLMQRLRMHPDLGGNDKEAAIINEAYAALTNPDNRAAYDKTRQAPERGGASSDAGGEAVHPQPQAQSKCVFCLSVHGFNQTIPTEAFCGDCRSPLRQIEHLHMEDQGRRAIVRVQKNHPITFYTRWPQLEPCSGITDDISMNGMKFRSSTPLALGQTVKLDAQILKAVASVTYSSQERSAWAVGVQFITLCFEQSRGSFITEQA